MSKPFEVTDPDKIAATVAEKWKKQYYIGGGKWRAILFGTGDSKDIYNALVSLGPEPDPDDIEEVIGNDSWTKTECDQCRVTNAPVVVISDGIDSDVSLCYGCATEASMMLWRTYYE